MALGDAVRRLPQQVDLSGLATMLASLKDQIVAETKGQIQDEIVERFVAKVGDALANLAVNVTAPAVSVAAPNVSVTPQITVESGEEPAINITVPGMDALAAQVAQNNALLQQLIALLKMPVKTTVERGVGSLISGTTQRRV